MATNDRMELRVAAVITDERGRAVFVRPKGSNGSRRAWRLPNGQVKHGQTLQETLRDCLVEQLGVRQATVEKLPSCIYQYMDAADGTHTVTLYFRVRPATQVQGGRDSHWVRHMDRSELAHWPIAAGDQDAVAG